MKGFIDKFNFLLEKTGSDFFDVGIYFDMRMNKYGFVISEEYSLNKGDFIKTLEGGTVEITGVVNCDKDDEMFQWLICVCGRDTFGFAKSKVSTREIFDWNELESEG